MVRQAGDRHTDQGSQFTAVAFAGVLIAAGARVSMDGRPEEVWSSGSATRFLPWESRTASSRKGARSQIL
jgi:transposase InsO family protein